MQNVVFAFFDAPFSTGPRIQILVDSWYLFLNFFLRLSKVGIYHMFETAFVTKPAGSILPEIPANVFISFTARLFGLIIFGFVNLELRTDLFHLVGVKNQIQENVPRRFYKEQAFFASLTKYQEKEKRKLMDKIFSKESQTK